MDPSGNVPVDYALDPVFLSMDINAIIQDPYNILNYIGLGIDIGLSIAPYVPAMAGIGIRSISNIDDFSDVFRSLDNTENIFKEGEKLIDVGKVEDISSIDLRSFTQSNFRENVLRIDGERAFIQILQI